MSAIPHLNSPKIRSAQSTDLAAIQKIMNHAIRHTTAIYDYTERSDEYMQQWFANKASLKFPVIVVELNQEVVGFGTFGAFRPHDGFLHTVEHSLYVNESYQGKGFGKLLLKALIQAATENGKHSMIGGIDGANTGSIALHEKCGFREAGRLKEAGFKFDRWLDLVFMELILK